MKTTDLFVFSRHILDGLVVVRKVSSDGSTVANLTDEEIQKIEAAMQKNSMPIFPQRRPETTVHEV